jgi:hypothetical protein
MAVGAIYIPPQIRTVPSVKCHIGTAYIGQDGSCHPVTTCAPWESEQTPPGVATDRQCVPSLKCRQYEFISNGSCVEARRCGPTEIMINNSVCVLKVTNCKNGQYIFNNTCVNCSVGTTTFSDQCESLYNTKTSCVEIAPTHDCGTGAYYVPGRMPGCASRSCVPCSKCAIGELTPCEGISDRTCIVSNAPPGIQQCPLHEYRDDSIPGDTGICVPCHRCAFKDVEKPCLPNAPRLCSAYSSEVAAWGSVVGIVVLFTIKDLAIRIWGQWYPGVSYIALKGSDSSV